MRHRSRTTESFPRCLGAALLPLLSLLCGASAIAQNFQFDATISRPVLENYLERSLSFTGLLHDDLTQQDLLLTRSEGEWTHRSKGDAF